MLQDISTALDHFSTLYMKRIKNSKDQCVEHPVNGCTRFGHLPS